MTIQEIIDQKTSSKECRPKTSWWFSDMGKCLSGVYYARLGKTPKPKDPRTLRVFEVGNIFEEWVCKALEGPTTIVRPETIHLPQYDLSGRPDAIITLPDSTKEVLEFKTVHSDKFWWMNKKNEGPDEHHLMQLWWGMKATGIPKGRLVYISKDDLCISEFTLDITDDIISTKCLEEINILNEAWNNKIPPKPVDTFINKKINWKAKYCDYHQYCLNNENWLDDAEQQLNVEKNNAKRI